MISLPRRALAWSGLGVALLLGANLLAFALLHPLDDAFIAFRYSRHLAQGHGAVFNVGQYVEGYSSPLWVWLMAPVIDAGLDPVVVATWLGGLAAVGCAVVAGALAVTLGAGPGGALVAAGLMAVAPSVGQHAANGLETTTFALLVSSVLLVLLRWPRRMGLLAALALAATVTRPEGVAVALGAFAWSGLRRARTDGPGSGRLLAALGLFLAGVGALLAWRWSTYGELLPNTWYAKSDDLSFRLSHGLGYLAESTWRSWFGLAVVVATFRAVREARRHGLFGPPSVPALAFLAGWCAIVLWEGGDYFHGFRFLLPAMPIAAGFVGLAATRLAATDRTIPAAALVALGVGPAATAWPHARHEAVVQSNLVESWSLIGRTLAERAPADRAVATSPIGAIGWYSGLETIDILGLTDAHIARVEPDRDIRIPAHRKHDADHVMDLRPDYLVVSNGLVSRTPATERPRERDLQYEEDLYEHAAFDDYVLRHLPLGDDLWLALYVRRDLPEADRWRLRPARAEPTGEPSGG
ncbi:MAG: hypothetical protein ACQEXJ_01045 [Myxococcota bacterium]